MTWCEENDVDYGFGLPGTKPLSKKVDETADAVRTERAVGDKDIVRGYAETRHKAGSWHKERRAVARIEATRLGLDVRFVVTNLDGSADWLYETLYCARGQAENLIKLHKAQLASDRTSCRSALANQVRLVLHTAAYWLMLPSATPFRKSATWPRPSSQHCASSCSRSPLAWSKWRAASVWPSPPPVPRPSSSPVCPPR